MQINNSNQISLFFRVNTFPIVYNPETQKHFTKLERPKDEGELMDTSSEVGKLTSESNSICGIRKSVHVAPIQ